LYLGFLLARQAIYHFSHTSNQDRVLLFSQASMDHNLFYTSHPCWGDRKLSFANCFSWVGLEALSSQSQFPK
jgi:hypothetical protein